METENLIEMVLNRYIDAGYKYVVLIGSTGRKVDQDIYIVCHESADPDRLGFDKDSNRVKELIEAYLNDQILFGTHEEIFGSNDNE